MRDVAESKAWVVEADQLRGEGQAVEHAIGLVARRGGGLRRDGAAVGRGDDDVGEGAAHVDADGVGHCARVKRRPVRDKTCWPPPGGHRGRGAMTGRHDGAP